MGLNHGIMGLWIMGNGPVYGAGVGVAGRIRDLDVQPSRPILRPPGAARGSPMCQVGLGMKVVLPERITSSPMCGQL